MSRSPFLFLCLATILLCTTSTYVSCDVDLRLGVAVPLSGDQSEKGHRQAIAVMIAAEEINSGRAFGIPNNSILPPGYTISVYSNDTKISPTIGCQAVNVLINTNHVIGIIGEYFSAVSQAISTFAGVFQVPIVSPGSSADDLSNKALYPYFSRTLGPARMSCAAMIDVVVSLGWRCATMLFSEDTFGTGQSNSFQQASRDLTVANKTSVKFVNVLSFPNGNQQKLYNALTIIKESLTISNVVIVGMSSKDYLLFIKLADQLGLIGKLNIIGTGDVSFQDLSKQDQDYYRPLLKGVITASSTLVTNDITPRVAAACRTWSGPFGSSWCEKTVDDRFMYFAYDAAYLYAYAFKNLIDMGLPLTGPNILIQLRNVTFLGSSGVVRLDSNGDRIGTYGIQNFLPEKDSFGFVGLVDMLSRTISYSQPILFRDGSNAIPSDREPLPPTPIYEANQSLQIPLYALAGIITAIIIGIAGFIIVQRQLSLFKAASVPFCLFMLFFAGLLSLSSMLYATQPNDSNINARFVCYGRPWFTGICITGLLAALLIKGSRIDRLFNTKTIQIKVGSNSQLMSMVGVMVLTQMIILIGLSAAQLTEPELVLGGGATSGSMVYQCRSIESKSFIIWLSIEIAFVTCMLIYGIRLAFRLRNVPSSFNESQQISHSIACLSFFLILLVPLQFIVQDNPNALILIRGYGQAIGSLMLCIVNFGPKLYFYFTAKDVRYKSNMSYIPSNETNISSIGNMAGNNTTLHSGFGNSNGRTNCNRKTSTHQREKRNDSTSVAVSITGSVAGSGPTNEKMMEQRRYHMHRSSMSLSGNATLGIGTNVPVSLDHLFHQHARMMEIVKSRIETWNGNGNGNETTYNPELHQEYQTLLQLLTTSTAVLGQPTPSTSTITTNNSATTTGNKAAAAGAGAQVGHLPGALPTSRSTASAAAGTGTGSGAVTSSASDDSVTPASIEVSVL